MSNRICLLAVLLLCCCALAAAAPGDPGQSAAPPAPAVAAAPAAPAIAAPAPPRVPAWLKSLGPVNMSLAAAPVAKGKGAVVPQSACSNECFAEYQACGAGCDGDHDCIVSCNDDWYCCLDACDGFFCD